MDRKVYFQEGLKPSSSLGFNRPSESIIDAPVVDIRTGKKKLYALFWIDIRSKLLQCTFSVTELMGLQSSPVKYEDKKPYIDPDGLLITIPADRSEPISFRQAK